MRFAVVTESERKGMPLTEQRERVERFTEELREGPEPSDRSIKEIAQALQPQIQELVNKQVELAKTELTPVGLRAGIAAALLAVGAVFMLVFLIILFYAVVQAFALILPEWAAALITSGILLVIGGGLAAAGGLILRTLDPVPRRTITALQQNIIWLTRQLKP